MPSIFDKPEIRISKFCTVNPIQRKNRGGVDKPMSLSSNECDPQAHIRYKLYIVSHCYSKYRKLLTLITG